MGKERHGGGGAVEAVHAGAGAVAEAVGVRRDARRLARARDRAPVPAGPGLPLPGGRQCGVGPPDDQSLPRAAPRGLRADSARDAAAGAPAGGAGAARAGAGGGARCNTSEEHRRPRGEHRPDPVPAAPPAAGAGAAATAPCSTPSVRVAAAACLACAVTSARFSPSGRVLSRHPSRRPALCYDVESYGVAADPAPPGEAHRRGRRVDPVERRRHRSSGRRPHRTAALPSPRRRPRPVSYTHLTLPTNREV